MSGWFARCFAWFRKYIRKIGIFGVEVEFHPPATSGEIKPEPQNASARQSVKPPPPSPSPPLRQEKQKPRDKQEKPVALQKCREPDCGKMVSTMAPMCPHCGCPTGAAPDMGASLPDFESVDDSPPDDFPDPFPAPMGMEEAKRAYLVGQEPKAKRVHLLVKVHDYRGKAIYLYNLLTGQLVQEANSNTPDIDARIARYRQMGHKVTHPGTIPYKDARRWCDHARSEARRLGLVIG